MTSHDHARQLASQLRAYLQHRITRTALVNWADNAMMEEELDERDLDTIRDITSRLGLADVREFGPTWEGLQGLLVAHRITLTSYAHVLDAGRAKMAGLIDRVFDNQTDSQAVTHV